jgi:hypothetical protein
VRAEDAIGAVGGRHEVAGQAREHRKLEDWAERRDVGGEKGDLVCEAFKARWLGRRSVHKK